MIFDNHDERIKYYELMFERKNLENIPKYPLPDGFKFVLYKQGDRDAWIEIEKSAKEFDSYAAGLDAWGKYYGGKDEELVQRMVFIENGDGEKVATASAFYDIHGRDKSGAGWLHWVSVRRDHQGMGLSKPLIAHTLEVMQSLGYTHVRIPTQSTSWVACKVYLDFGFLPIPQNAVNSRDGWRIVKALTSHPALSEFDSAELSEILAEK